MGVQNVERLLHNLDQQTRDSLGMDVIHIESGALTAVAPYVQSKFHVPLLVVDDITYEVAGRKLEQYLDEQSLTNRQTVFITANEQGDVVADEQSLIELIMAAKNIQPDVLLAVGSGTLHDITRMVGYILGIPFVSVPTAPSVDGFNSKGAPIILRGEKKTIVSIGPNAIFADLDILAAAPRKLIAAGFGDILGKYTSLFDWKFGQLTNNEPYLEQSFVITKHALDQCVAAVSSIAHAEKEGIAILMSGLIESGIAMLIFGKSHPASGAEHHLSHYWEMKFIKEKRKQLLHGAKVGVATTIIAELYHKLAEQDYGLNSAVRPSVTEHWNEIKSYIEQIPTADHLRQLLLEVGGPSTIDQLGISQPLLDESLLHAHFVRPERYTLLHAFNIQHAL